MLLENKVPVLVFPEGTRSKDGSVGHFKPGAAALASATDSPILPIGIIGAHEAHPRGSKWPKAGRLSVGIVFGAPMKAKPGENPTEFIARVRTTILSLLDEHSARILNGQSPDPKRSAKENK
jgi:1-acyl-sn-glycerol-3-phosphate acyltransferase